MPSTFLDWASSGLLGASWGAAAVYFLVATQLTILTVTLYLHRSMAHRAVDFHPALAHVFRLWTWLSTAMVTREWTAVHRKHHAHCETAEDPHSPQVYGIRAVLWRGVELYKQAAVREDDLEKYGKGCPNDWIERHLYTPFSALGPTLLLFALVALFGAKGLAAWALQMAWIPFWAAGVVNGLGHWWGYRNFESADTSTNLSPWGVWIGGEELHNNHHAFPSSAKFALRRFEFDIGWATIRTFERLRLARVLRVAPTLNVRPNIARADNETLKALLAHRFLAMTDYYRRVLLPTLREEATQAGASLRALPRRLRKGLANDGRWLDADARERLHAFVDSSPKVALLVEYRRRLAAVLEERSNDAGATLQRLQDWCREAEASGVRALVEFAARLRGYALAPART